MLLYGITERIQIRDYIQTNIQFNQINSWSWEEGV